jgi:SAM-dependent methyltransferase
MAIAPEGPVLDVGAGEGSLIDSLNAKGREAVGLDPYSHRDDFLTNDIAEVEGEWASVVFWHSLEHLPDPTRHLKEAARLLMRGGVLVVAVPNPESLQSRWFGKRWLHLDYPRHLVHIPAGPLQHEVTSNGLRIRRLSYYRGGNVVFGWLHGMVGSVSSSFELYDAIRKPAARSRPMTSSQRWASIALGVALLPFAVVASVVEVALHRGGTIYLEAVRP